MPSENLGVGVFGAALGSSTPTMTAPVAARGFSPQALPVRRGLPWMLAAGLLAAGDVGVVTAIIVASVWFGVVPPGSADLSLIGLPVLVVLAFLERGLYGRAALPGRDFPVLAITAAWVHAIGVFLLLRIVVGPAVMSLFGVGGGEARALASATLDPMLLTGFVFGLLTLLAWRLLWRASGAVSWQPATDRVVIVGDTSECARLMPSLRDQAGVELVGVIEPAGGGHAGAARTLDGLQIMSGLEELSAMVRGGLVDTALVAPSRHDDGTTLRSVLAQARVTTLDVKVLPQAVQGSAGPAALSRIGNLPVVEVHRRPLDARARRIKRIEDVVIGGAMLLMLLPVVAAIAVAIRWETKGPIFFRQPRVGLNGNVFEMFKFRSMYHHAVDPGAVRQTARGDKRVTRVGAILRRHSLDELPQILNVLRGDMSIVGPRPHALAMTAQGMALEEAATDYPARFRMKPGITGWAQTNGWRGNVDTVEKLVRRVEHDLHYIDNWSLGLDLLILRKTVSCVFSDETAY